MRQLVVMECYGLVVTLEELTNMFRVLLIQVVKYMSDFIIVIGVIGFSLLIRVV